MLFRWCWCSWLVGSIYKFWVTLFLRISFFLYKSIHSFFFWSHLPLFRIAECFGFLVCTKWSNPMIHRRPYHGEASSSSTAIRYRDWNSGLLLSSLEDNEQEDTVCSLQDIGGHIMKVPLIVFQILLCMRLEVCCAYNSLFPHII